MSTKTVNAADLERVLEHACNALDDRTEYLNGEYAADDYGDELDDALAELSEDWAAYRRVAGYSPEAD